MSTGSYTDPAFDELAARVGTAFRAEAGVIEPDDAWTSIVSRLEAPRRRVPWWLWLRQRPLLIGAAAVLVALVAVVAVNLLAGDEEAQDLDIVDTPDEPPPTIDPEAGPVVGARADGSLVLLDAATGEVVEGLVTAEGFNGPRPPDDGGDASLLRELAVSPDGQTVYQARPTALGGTACEGSEFAADWGLWEVDVEEHEGNFAPILASGERGVQQSIPPGRTPTPSPDGSMLAFVTTSNYEACDDSLVVAVGDLSGLGTIVATHTLPAGVMPNYLVWSTPDRLDIVVPMSDPAGGPIDVVGVAVDPMVSGPISVEGEPLDGGTLVAPGREVPYLAAATTPDGVTTIQSAEDPFLGDQSSPAWDVTLSGPGLGGGPLALAQDGAGSVWFTLRREGGSGIYGDGQTSWRVPFDEGSPADDPVQVSDAFIAVAASPFRGRGPTRDDTPSTTIDAGPETTAASTTTTTAPDPAAFVYVTVDGGIYRQAVGGGTPQRLGTVPGALTRGINFVVDPHPSPTPDGSAVIFGVPDTSNCGGTVYSISTAGGSLTTLAEGSSPALSPDGTQLAYLALDGTQAPGLACETDLVVRDLATGGERRWRDVESNDPLDSRPGQLTNLHWAPDNRTLVLSRAGVFYTVDTTAPEGDLPLVRPQLAFARVVVPTDLYLVGVTDVEGATALVFAERCFFGVGCAAGGVVHTVPVDGPPGQAVSVPDLSTFVDVGPNGLLFVACPADTTATVCRGSEIRVQGSSGGPQPVAATNQLLVAVAWVP